MAEVSHPPFHFQKWRVNAEPLEADKRADRKMDWFEDTELFGIGSRASWVVMHRASEKEIKPGQFLASAGWCDLV